MRVLQLTVDNFDDAVSRSSCLVIEFSPSVDDFARRAEQVIAQDGVDWGHVDPAAQSRLAASFGIASDTALLVFREQVVLYLEDGMHDPVTMTDLIRKVRDLDMPKIKAEIEAEKQAELALRMRRVCPTARRGPM